MDIAADKDAAKALKNEAKALRSEIDLAKQGEAAAAAALPACTCKRRPVKQGEHWRQPPCRCDASKNGLVVRAIHADIEAKEARLREVNALLRNRIENKAAVKLGLAPASMTVEAVRGRATRHAEEAAWWEKMATRRREAPPATKARPKANLASPTHEDRAVIPPLGVVRPGPQGSGASGRVTR